MIKVFQNLMLRNFPFLDSRICNPQTGLVSDLFQWMPEADDPKIYMVAAKMAKKDVNGHVVASEINSAAGLSLKEAYTKAVGETIERYSSSFIPDNLIVDTYNNLHQKAADPESFAFYADEQYSQHNFPFEKFTRNSVVAWTEGLDLATGEGTLVPASSVYLPYFFKKDEAKTWICISTGLAASTSMLDAIIRGIYEIVERDAISNMWFNHLSMPLIDLNQSSYLHDLFETKLKILNGRYHLVNMTTDIGIPSVFGVLEEPGRGGLVAAASNADPVKAVRKTLIELSQGRISWKTDFVKGVNRSFKDDYSDIRDFNSRVELYTQYKMKKHLRFVYASHKKEGLPQSSFNFNKSQAKLLQSIVEKITSKGFHVYCVNLTPPDILQAGYFVVRILIPGMTEISNDSVYPRLGGTRLSTLPLKLGYSNHLQKFSDYNLIPHPFP